ncbi:hypothetical protein L5G32_07550 [Gordonia sp. HY002]|uniref:hypothetical protein n=1 Tax=Gordonia zhenghanii TaxID=2911516 RepID=UPI001EEF9286|nr:hypothetical protein [Gordonia zhenghanii]MCF8570117.1 hypothetical protein [Gordonia zhenghanii]MCF8605416.1 hypothetical protein [Gordonia zhenghanii]
MNSDEISEPDSVDEPVSEETGAGETSAETGDVSAADDDAQTQGGDDSADGDDSAEDDSAEDDSAGDDSAEDDSAREPSDESSGADGESDSPRHPVASMVLAVAVAALVAAVVCVGYFGYTGIRAYTVDSGREQARVEAVDGAEQAMLNILTVDDTGVDEWQKRMKSSLTGDALKQAIEETSGGVVKQIEAAKKNNLTIKASIVRSAATELNPDEDTATVFVLSQAATSEAPGQPQPQSTLLSMVKDDGAWKADKIVPLTDITYYDDSATPESAPQSGTPQSGTPQSGTPQSGTPQQGGQQQGGGN